MLIGCLSHRNEVFFNLLTPKYLFQCHSCRFWCHSCRFWYHSCGFHRIPAEWLHSCRNEWGMIKYCCHAHMHCLLLTGTSHVHHAYITIHHLNLGTPIEGLSHGQFYYYLHAFILIFLSILFSFFFISSYLQQTSLTWCNFQGPDSRVEHQCLGCLHWGLL